MTSTDTAIPVPERLAWTYPEAATMAGISERFLRKLVAKGEAPKPVKFGRSSRFVAETFREWVRNGVPAA